MEIAAFKYWSTLQEQGTLSVHSKVNCALKVYNSSALNAVNCSCTGK